MRILITGASGYLGATITKYLHQQGNYYIIAWCRNPDADKEHVLRQYSDHLIIGDILDKDCLNEAIRLKPDVLIHLVSLDHKQSETDVEKAQLVNVLPTFKLLDSFKNTSLTKFVYFSTMQVLGPLGNNIITHDFKPNPQNIYALTHFMSEQLLRYYETKNTFKPLIIRLANGYGSPVFTDNNCWWLVVNDLCKTAYLEKRIMLQSDGSPQRDFIHVSDIAKIIHYIIIKPNNSFSGSLFNLANGKTYTILELAIVVKRVYLKKYNLDIPIFTPKGELKDLKIQEQLPKYTIDISGLNQLGLNPEVSIEEGVSELFDYLNRN